MHIALTVIMKLVYRLVVPHYLRHFHDVFLVYVLRHYITDPTHDIDMSSLQFQMRVHSRRSQSVFWTIAFDN
jgi:hypothetical protein